MPFRCANPLTHRRALYLGFFLVVCTLKTHLPSILGCPTSGTTFQVALSLCAGSFSSISYFQFSRSGQVTGSLKVTGSKNSTKSAAICASSYVSLVTLRSSYFFLIFDLPLSCLLESLVVLALFSSSPSSSLPVLLASSSSSSS